MTLSMALSQLACVPPRGQVMDGLAAEGCGLDSKAQPRLLALLLARTRSVMEPSQPRQAHGVGWGSGRHLPRIPLPGDWGPVLLGTGRHLPGGHAPQPRPSHDPLPAPLRFPTGTEPSVTEPLVVPGVCPSTAVRGPSSGGGASGAGDVRGAQTSWARTPASQCPRSRPQPPAEPPSAAGTRPAPRCPGGRPPSAQPQ